MGSWEPVGAESPGEKRRERLLASPWSPCPRRAKPSNTFPCDLEGHRKPWQRGEPLAMQWPPSSPSTKEETAGLHKAWIKLPASERQQAA